jgi:hypothetical protein
MTAKLNPAVYFLNATVDFRVRRDTYLRHFNALAAAKAILDTTQPSECRRVMVYQTRVAAQRARLIQHDRTVYGALQRAEKTRAEARKAFTTPPPEYFPTSSDWEIELEDGMTDTPSLLKAPRLIAPKILGKFPPVVQAPEKKVIRDEGMVVVDTKPSQQKHVAEKKAVQEEKMDVVLELGEEGNDEQSEVVEELDVDEVKVPDVIAQQIEEKVEDEEGVDGGFDMIIQSAATEDE